MSVTAVAKEGKETFRKLKKTTAQAEFVTA
jgi:hypothetical protein